VIKRADATSAQEPPNGSVHRSPHLLPSLTLRNAQQTESLASQNVPRRSMDNALLCGTVEERGMIDRIPACRVDLNLQVQI
jgi:hypothetical protein